MALYINDTCINWKSIVGYEGIYEISDTGSIRSLDRLIVNSLGVSRNIRGIILKQNNLRNNYLGVSLAKNGGKKTFAVHKLVIRTFNPLKDEGNFVCNHIDCDRQNNHTDNLEWVTIGENNRHSYLHGNQSRKGDRHNNKKICQKDAEEIRKLSHETNMTQKEIGAEFNISAPMVSNIINNKNWN